MKMRGIPGAGAWSQGAGGRRLGQALAAQRAMPRELRAQERQLRKAAEPEPKRDDPAGDGR